MRFARRVFDWNFRTRKNNKVRVIFKFLCECVRVVGCYYIIFIAIDRKSANATLNSNISITLRPWSVVRARTKLIC